MKKQYLGLFLLLVIAVTACACTKKTTKKTAPQKTSAVTYIKIERTPCFGTCPNYTVELYASGLARYTGRAYAKPQGVYEKNIGKNEVAYMLDLAAKNRIDTCKAQYPMDVADLPGLIVSYTYNGKENRILNAEFGPSYLKEMAGRIDLMVKPTEDGWKKMADAGKK